MYKCKENRQTFFSDCNGQNVLSRIENKIHLEFGRRNNLDHKFIEPDSGCHQGLPMVLDL
jgi:hypothetical protein